jgi:hypothetical protein
LASHPSETPDPGENRVRAAHELSLYAASLGVFASTAMLVLWVALAVISHNYPQSTTSDTWLRMAEMVTLAIVGLLASLKKWPLLMLVVFLASFFPVGLYMLGTPSVFRLIGVADLLYLGTTLWLLVAWVRTFSEKGWFASLVDWLWINSAVFALLAGLLKASLFPAPQWNPPFDFVMITAFGVTVLVWWLLFLRSRETTLLRGVVAGMFIGGLIPPLMWLPYGLYLAATTPRPLEALGWSPVYAYLMLVRVSPYTTILGAGLGALLASLQKFTARPDP